MLAAANVLFATTLYGPGLGGDAVWTISAAHNLVLGRGLVTSSEELYSLWPPLYPGLIAAAELIGLDVFTALRWLHASCLAAVVILTSHAVERITASRWLRAAQACLMASSLPLFAQSIEICSEPVFVFLCAATLACAVRAIESGSKAQWWTMTALSACACLQRYLGVALVASIALLGVLHGRDARVRKRWLRAASYALLSVLPLMAWMVRNYVLEDKWTGGRTAARQSLAQISADALSAMRTWIDPVRWFEAVPGLLWCLVAIAIGVGWVLARRSLRATARGRELDAYASFATVYVVLLIGLSSIWLVDPIRSRLLLPALPFGVALTLVGAAELERAAWRNGRIVGACARGAVAVAIGVHVIAGSIGVARTMARARAEGAGSFHTRFWMEQPLVAWLRTHPVSGVLRSNAPEMIWLVTGQPARMLRPSRKLARDLGSNVASTGRPCTVLWFTENGKPVLFVDEIAAEADVERVWDGPRASVVIAKPRTAER